MGYAHVDNKNPCKTAQQKKMYEWNETKQTAYRKKYGKMMEKKNNK